MGTNYYIIDNLCEHCGRSDEYYHIGKSSAGWCFSLHVEPKDNICDLSDIMKMWQGKQIKNEYGEIISEAEMLCIITDRFSEMKEKKPFGYESWDQFHEKNYSEFGPKNLLRHRHDGMHCVGHGNGTYDFIKGEFS